MAAVVTPQPTTPARQKLWYHVRLVPELLVLPLIGAGFLALNQPAWLAWLGELVVLMFVLRTVGLWMAWRTWKKGRYTRAERWSGLAWLLYPWSADVATTRALIASAQGDLDRTLHWLLQAEKLFPERTNTTLGLGGVFATKHDWEKARWYALQVIAKDSTCSPAYALLAQASLHLFKDRIFALELVDRGLEHAQDSAMHALLYTVRAEASLDNPAMCIAALEQVLRVLPFCPSSVQAECVYRIGAAYAQINKPAAALHEFERISRIDPEGRWLGRAWRAQQEILMKL